MPSLVFISASQIKTADSCLRQWAFRYLSLLPSPGTKSTALGQDCHTGWEYWLRDGHAPQTVAPMIARQRAESGPLELVESGVDVYAERIVNICTSAIPHLPIPQSAGLAVEGRFQFEDHGVHYQGYKDLTYWVGDTRIIHDHKTTSALKWAKTEEQLRTDVQVLLYAQSEFARTAVPEINCHWHYTTTDSRPTTRRVHLTLARDETNDACANIAERAKTLLKYYAERPDPNSLPAPADLSVCNAYGGCPFRPVCNITAVDRIRGAFRYQQIREAPVKPVNNFLARLAQTKAQPAPAHTETPPLLQTEPAPAPEPKTARERLQPPPPSPGATGVIPEIPPVIIQASAPPEASAQTVPAPAPEAPAASRRGRPRKVTPPVAGSTVPEVTIAVETAPKISYRDVGGFVLYINCMPENEPVASLEDLLSPLADEVAEQMGVPDYRLAEYGKGKDALLYALKCRLEQLPLEGNVVIDLRTPEGAQCAATLARFATRRIRGF